VCRDGEQSIIDGDFRMYWSDDVIVGDNLAVGDHVSLNFVTGRLDKSRDHVLVRDANYHPDGGQVFFPPPGGRPYVLLLASADRGDDVRPEHFRAFHFDGSAGFQIAPGVWHNAPYFPRPTSGGRGDEMEMTFRNKQSSVYACVLTDVVREFGVYLKVPLTLGAA